MTAISNVSFNMVIAVFVLFAVGPASAMRLTDAGYGLLIAALGVGALIGSMIAAHVSAKIGRTASLVITVVACVIQIATPIFTANVVIIGAAFFISGIGLTLWNVVVVTLRQLVAPPHLLGRTNASYRLVSWGVQPLGSLLGGVLTAAIGLRPVFAIAAALQMLTLLGFLTLNDRSMREAIDD
jgi:MFS family permease